MNCFGFIKWLFGSAILNNLETTTTNLASAKTELSNTKSAVTDLTTKFNGKFINLKFYE